MGEHLSEKEKVKLLDTLKERFNDNMHRHPEITWDEIENRLVKQPDKLWSLNEMERTGGNQMLWAMIISLLIVLKIHQQHAVAFATIETH